MEEIKKTGKKILAENRDRISPLSRHFIVLAHNIRSLYNVGSLFRTADALGVHSLWLSGYTPRPPRPEISKTALGAEENVDWTGIDDPVEMTAKLKAEGYLIYGLEQTIHSDPITEHTLTGKKICLVLGNEVTGIEDQLLAVIDHFVEIPQFGEKHSMNVSVAAGIALYAFLEKMR